MEIYLPNSAKLQNFGGFIRRIKNPDDMSGIAIEMSPSYINLHPAAIAMTACAGLQINQNAGSMWLDMADNASSRYLDRMGLFKLLDIDTGLGVVEHDPTGRFIPLRVIRHPNDLEALKQDLIPLLHATPEQVAPILYVFSELISNAIEHSGSSVGAVACAQYYKRHDTVALGVADLGQGIGGTMARFHHPASDLEAIHLALTPGVSGTSANIGGSESNAGAGLFFTKSIARLGRNYFVAYSGDAMFKLKPGSKAKNPLLHSNPSEDHATRETGLPAWPGTVMGIDISVADSDRFDDLLHRIYKAYNLGVRLGNKDKYRKARFS